MSQSVTASPSTKTVDLIDQFNQTDWSAVDSWDGPTEAGLDLRAYVEQLERVPQAQYEQQRQQVRLLSILWPALKQWLESWNLGLSFDAVYREAKQRIYAHVAQPTPEQSEWLDALLQEDDQNLPDAERVIRAQVIPTLSLMLSETDRDALSNVAAQAMKDGILGQYPAAS